jgi:hypothetical protein
MTSEWMIKKINDPLTRGVCKLRLLPKEWDLTNIIIYIKK